MAGLRVLLVVALAALARGESVSEHYTELVLHHCADEAWPVAGACAAGNVTHGVIEEFAYHVAEAHDDHGHEVRAAIKKKERENKKMMMSKTRKKKDGVSAVVHTHWTFFLFLSFFLSFFVSEVML